MKWTNKHTNKQTNTQTCKQDERIKQSRERYKYLKHQQTRRQFRDLIINVL
jgi:hypothetical protein